jgi:hypothetical protein
MTGFVVMVGAYEIGVFIFFVCASVVFGVGDDIVVISLPAWATFPTFWCDTRKCSCKREIEQRGAQRLSRPKRGEEEWFGALLLLKSRGGIYGRE